MTGFSSSITLSGLGMLHGAELTGLVDAVVAAEEAGIDQVVITDHLAIGPNTDRYPYGTFPFPNEEPWPEPLTALAVFAGATRRIRLGTGVLIVPLRPALLLAKTLATLDVLSGGRVDVGVGSGWQREEFEANGVPFEGRFARMDDTLGACRAIWRESPVSFSSPTVSFEGLYCEPSPVQRGGPPLWFGVGLGPRNIERIVRFGAGWMPILSDVDALASGVDTLRSAFATAGRNADELGVRGAPPPVLGKSGRVDLGATLDGVEAFTRAGATIISLPVAAFVRKPDGLEAFFSEFAARARG